MIKFTKTFDNVGVLDINYKIGGFFDKCFIEFELGEYKEFHLKKRREFMVSIENEVRKEKMQKVEIAVYETDCEDAKKFEAFIINEQKSIKTKSESKKSELDAVEKLCDKALGNKVFKYRKTKNGMIYNTWEAILVEPVVCKNIELYEVKPKKSRATELRERRKKQTLVQFIATPKAEENLKKMCESTGLNKTQVINKLLEEQEQLKLL